MSDQRSECRPTDGTLLAFRYGLADELAAKLAVIEAVTDTIVDG
jgi:hypothetical protein